METATSTTVAVVPGVVKYSPNVAKAWVEWDASSGTPTIKVSLNVSSLTDNATGDTTVNFTTAFSTAFYGYAGACIAATVAAGAFFTAPYNPDGTTLPTASAFRLATVAFTGSLVDSKLASAAFFGDF